MAIAKRIVIDNRTKTIVIDGIRFSPAVADNVTIEPGHHVPVLHIEVYADEIVSRALGRPFTVAEIEQELAAAQEGLARANADAAQYVADLQSMLATARLQDWGKDDETPEND